MNQETTPDERAASLRQRAEEQVRAEETRQLTDLSPEEIRHLLHELRVHQIELEMQNEELRRVQLELEASRARYIELYDLALVGYLTVSRAGLILEANLTAVTLLGVARGALLRQALSRYILPEDQDIYYRHHKQLFETSEPQACEMRLMRPDACPFWARLEATVAHDADSSAPVCRIMMSDISARKQVEEQLTRLLERLNLATRTAHLGIWDWDIQNDELVWDDRMYELYGVKREDFAGAYQAWLAGIHPDDRAASDEVSRQARRGERDYDTEFRVVWPDGTVRVLKAYGQVLWDPAGQPQRMIGINYDITERKQAEEALRESEDKYRRLVEDSIDGIAIVQGLEMRFVNPALLKMFGYRHKDEMVGHAFTDFLAPEYRALMANRGLSREEGQGVPAQYEFRAVHKDGTKFDAELSVSAITYEGDAARQGIIRDITERKQAEQERERLLAQVREQARRVQTIVDTVPEGVLLLDAEQRLLLANPAAQEALALLAEAGPGRPLTRLGDRPLAELLAPPPPGLRHEVRAGGHIFEVLAHPIQDDDEPERWVLALADATQERQVRARLEQQERLAAIGQLAAGMAHDMNNALATVVLSAQMLQKSPNLSDRERHYLATMLGRVDVATQLMGQILDFGQRSYLQRAPVDLLRLVRESIDSLQRTLPEDIHLELRNDCDGYVIHGDAARLQQAILNLAANARDAMPAGGRLQFALSLLAVGPDTPPPLADMVAGDWVCLSVSDTGVGIAPEHLPLLFEPFFTTKEPGQGAGLGLSQVYGIVKQHGGAIAVHSQPGAGATFSIYLPLLGIPTLPPAWAPARAPAGVPAVKATPGGVQTILLVEPESALREVIAATLQELGYCVLSAASGAEALPILTQESQAIDLLLSDSTLPGMSGLDLFRAMHRQHIALKAILMSDNKEPSPGLPDVDCLEKPFELEVLATKIAAMLASVTPPTGRSRWRREGG